TNALGFAIGVVRDDPQMLPAERRRNATRGMFMMAGYLHEALNLLETLTFSYGEQYKEIESFQQLTALVKPESFKEHKSVVKAIRDSVGFHLDHHRKSTKDPIAKIEQNSDYDILSMNVARRFFYLDIADEIDLVHLVQKFRAGKEAKAKTMLRLMNLITEL